MHAGSHRIRPATDADLERINDIYNHYVSETHVTFDVEPRSLEWRRTWFEEHDGGRYRALVAESDGRVSGYASSSRYRPRPAYDTSVETSVYVDHGHVGRGIGTALYTALLEMLEPGDVHRILGGVALPNDASLALHRRLGFGQVGVFTEQGFKFGRYWDVAWFERPSVRP